LTLTLASTQFLDVNGDVDCDSIVDLDLERRFPDPRESRSVNVRRQRGVDVHVAVKVNDARQRSSQ